MLYYLEEESADGASRDLRVWLMLVLFSLDTVRRQAAAIGTPTNQQVSKSAFEKTAHGLLGMYCCCVKDKLERTCAFQSFRCQNSTTAPRTTDACLIGDLPEAFTGCGNTHCMTQVVGLRSLFRRAGQISRLFLLTAEGDAGVEHSPILGDV